MRVLFVNPGRDLGGAEQSLLLLLRELLRRDVEPTVALFGEGPFAASLARLGVRTAYLLLTDAVRRSTRYRAGVRLADLARLGAQAVPGVAQLVALAARLRVDLVHTNGLKAHVLGGLAGRIALRPVIWHVRDFPPEGAQGRVLRVASKTLPRIMLTNSAAVAAAWRPDGDPRHVRALGNPVDLVRFHPEVGGQRIRAELGIAADSAVIGMVAHLTRWKGHEDFLRMALQVSDRVPGARFLVSGGPIYETEGHEGYDESLKRRAVDLGLGGRVHFLGNRDDIPEILAALDVLVHYPAAPEPFGRAVAEAMAVGRPVVAARAGGLPEIVEHEVTGLLVPPGDVGPVAAAVIRLVGDPALRARYGAAGRLRAELLFDPGQHAEKVLQAYRAVL
jgi:glycosyltransferase involved in cell wall biosynthesis